MNIETNDLSDCILGMKAVKSLIADDRISQLGILFENNMKAYVKQTKSGYSVYVSKIG